MAEEIVAYHGTWRERGKDILEKQEMKISRGDKHWLGDGSYFFKDDFWSYKWCRDMYESRYNKLTDAKLLSKYQIIKASIKNARIFDLDILEYRKIYDEVLESIRDNKKRIGLTKNDIDKISAEGVIINYLFQNLGYQEDFDLVAATFTRNHNNYKGINSRLNYITQRQLCVKNLQVINNLEEYDYSSKIKDYKKILETLFLEKRSAKTYNSKKKGIYYH